MSSSMLTRKGQITVPISVRRRLGLKQGDRIAFVEREGRIVLEPVKNDVKAAFGMVKASRSLNLADMKKAIRARASRSTR